MNSTSTTASYLPRNLDLVYLCNGAGGYIGGVRDKQAFLRIVDHAKDWEKFIFEATADKFSLRQAVSNLYIGGAENSRQLLRLTPEKKEWEIWKYNSIPGGMVQIQNHKGLHLAAGQDKRLTWGSSTPVKESWKFELVSAGSDNPTHSTGVNLPQEGKVYGIVHNHGGYIGGFKDIRKKLDVVQKFQDFEKWTIERKDNLFVLRQKASGLYLGETNSLNERPGLIDGVGESEVFNFEWKENGQFVIRNFRGLYLSSRENHLIWTDSCTSNELWKLEEDKPKPSVEPVNGHLYGVQHVSSGGFIGSERTKGHVPRFTQKLDEWEQYYFEANGGVFALKQRVSGLYLGASDKVGDPVKLTDRRLTNETFQLVNQNDGLFSIKNHSGLWMSKQGDFTGWSKDCGKDELWRFVLV